MKNKNNLLINHTLIGSEIEKSIKSYKWRYILSDLPVNSFLVGGFIRDLILGKNKEKYNIDLDIIVPQNAYIVGNCIAKKYKGKFILLDHDREIVRIIFEGLTLDIAPQISESLFEDLSSRDFTINSISFSIDKNLIFDPLNGIEDIHKELLKTYQPKNLLDDPLRILRCFRFVSELNFKIDKNLLTLIKIYKNELASVSAERIQYELKKIIRGKNAFNTILLIKQTQIFHWMQTSESHSNFVNNNLNLNNFDNDEICNFLPIFFLIETLNDLSIQKLKFSKSEALEASSLRKWRDKLVRKPINKLDESERFLLHKELEDILPAFILYLPEKDQLGWLTRWRDKEDKLFHPSNLVDGNVLKKHIKIKDGPLLGELLNFLSKELAYKRIKSSDDAIYKAKQWFQQNAPKYD